MKVRIAYGRGALAVDVPDTATVIEPADPPALADEHAEFTRAVRAPIATGALRDTVGSHESVVIVTSDVTRATPNHKLIPWLLDELAHVPAEHITVIVGTGSHRATTPAELEMMFGAAALARVRVVDHDAHDPAQTSLVGTTSLGAPAYLSRAYLAADKRIVVGFIEPHFYAGFSGGPKGVMPGVAGIETVNFFHNARMVGDPGARWLNLDGNPIATMCREIVAMAPPHFLVNVTLDRAQRITGFFCGDYLRAHERGTAFCRAHASRELPQRFDVVLAGGGGYPLDQSLYQCGKGLTAAAGIAKSGSTIVLCGEMSDGIPEHGNFKELLRSVDTPRALLDKIEAPGFSMYDQWAAQSQALVLLRARVYVKSSLPDETIRGAMLEPVHDPAQCIRAALAAAGADATCAVLPEGPYVVPYVAQSALRGGAR